MRDARAPSLADLTFRGKAQFGEHWTPQFAELGKDTGYAHCRAPDGHTDTIVYGRDGDAWVVRFKTTRPAKA